MYEDLCKAVGDERFDFIRDLKIRDVQNICRYAKSCNACPLALHYTYNTAFRVFVAWNTIRENWSRKY